MMTVNPNLAFLERNKDRYRVFALQGGTRSGKTYAVLHWIIRTCMVNTGLTISVVRQSMPALRATVLRDFIEILQAQNMYQPALHNKSTNEYYLRNNRVEFYSIDDEQKVRGRKRDILFVNEANEVSLDKWRQLMNRTTGKAVLDYNPSQEQGWIYEHVLPRPDCATLITTYKDNPHLEPAIVAEIESYKDMDVNYWRVYGLGQRGLSNTTVYTHWRQYDNTLSPSVPLSQDIAYGLDFGYNVPTALVRCTFNTAARQVWVEECLYQSNMTSGDLVEWFKVHTIPYNALVYADNAEPDRIEELNRAGWRGVKPANKDVEAGISRVKSVALHIHKDSLNLIKELHQYKWHVDKNGQVLDTPVKVHDHALDAMRYAIHTHLNKPNGKYLIL